MKKNVLQTDIQIPQGYSLEEILDLDDSDFNEEATVCEEVTLRFGTEDGQKSSI